MWKNTFFKSAVTFHYHIFSIHVPHSPETQFISFLFSTNWKISLSVTLCLTLPFSPKSPAQPEPHATSLQRALIVLMIQLFNRNKCGPCNGCAVKGDCKHTQSIINLSSHAVSLKEGPDECQARNRQRKRWDNCSKKTKNKIWTKCNVMHKK